MSRKIDLILAYATGDTDGDGYTNTEEFELGLDPLTADADYKHNGISDRIENGLEIVPMLKLLLLRKKPVE